MSNVSYLDITVLPNDIYHVKKSDVSKNSNNNVLQSQKQQQMPTGIEKMDVVIGNPRFGLNKSKRLGRRFMKTGGKHKKTKKRKIQLDK